MIVTNWTGTKGRVATFANDIHVIVLESGLVSMMQNNMDIKIYKKIKILRETSISEIEYVYLYRYISSKKLQPKQCATKWNMQIYGTILSRTDLVFR